MTIREKFAQWLEYRGRKLVAKSEKRWVYTHADPACKHFLGASGSWRIGVNYSNSFAVSEKTRQKALAWSPLDDL
jgi:hypothetical protein